MEQIFEMYVREYDINNMLIGNVNDWNYKAILIYSNLSKKFVNKNLYNIAEWYCTIDFKNSFKYWEYNNVMERLYKTYESEYWKLIRSLSKFQHAFNI